MTRVMVLTLALWTATVEGSEMDRGQLLKLLAGLQSGLKDVEFVYESEIIHVDGRSRSGRATDHFDRSFQGVFAFRSDNAAHDEQYMEQPDDRSASLVSKGVLPSQGSTCHVVRGSGQAKTPRSSVL